MQPGLFGRDAEVSVIRETIEAVEHGKGGCLIIEGDAGMGKSRLLDVAAYEGTSRGLAVAQGRAAGVDRAVPFTSLLAALRGGTVPALHTADLLDADPRRLGFVDQIRARIAQYTSHRPLIIALDDVHRVDELTALGIRLLVPGLADAAVLWLLARRPAPATGTVQEALDDLLVADARRLRLGPISDDAVVEMCVRVFGAPPDRHLFALTVGSDGNPALLHRLLLGLREAGLVQVHEGVASLLTRVLPPSFLNAVDREFSSLPPEVRRFVDAASIFGRPFTVHELAGLVSRPATDVVRDIGAAVDAGLLVDLGAAFSFRHELVRTAIRELLPGPVRVVLHREAAALLGAGGAATGTEIAAHVVDGGWSGEELVERLLGVVGEDEGGQPHELVGDTVRHLLAAGRLFEARAVIDRTPPLRLDPEHRSGLLMELAEVVTYAGLDIDLGTSARLALDKPGLTAAATARLRAVQAHALLHGHGYLAARETAQVAVELAQRADDCEAWAIATLGLSVLASADGELEEAVRYAREATAAVEKLDQHQCRHRPQLWLARTLIAIDRLEEAEAVLDAAQRLDRTSSTPWTRPVAHYHKALLRMVGGRLDDAMREAEAAISTTRPLNSSHVRPLALLGYLAMLRDEMPAARQYLHQADQLAPASGCGALEVAWRTALLHHAAGNHQQALATLVPMYQALPQRPLVLAEEPQAAATLVRIAHEADEPEKAEVVAEAVGRLLSRNEPHRTIAAGAAHAAALVRGDRRMLRAAVEKYRGSARPLARAAAMEDAANAETAAGNAGAALPLLREAYEHYRKAGAKRAAARVRAALDRHASGSPPVPAPAPAPRQAPDNLDWGGLTESEVRVVTLVAEGLTNREVASRLYLSPHTVDSHLRSSFAKLGVSSRVQLTRKVLKDLAQHPESQHPEKT
ncbi:AAA family ATPase [Phytohabitans aurantiacus]|jgi:DNA-binding CsgD family transcriptional regulator/tetratricopeptide (TPR) repeat protein|uniref:AAA family ATPase n=1 Tax=Phytohabitans aurantiacus TaxID=3016789 RepID=UPI00249236A1|nr:AAA family ATPase [Phytohabitans aurantiacus]